MNWPTNAGRASGITPTSIRRKSAAPIPAAASKRPAGRFAASPESTTTTSLNDDRDDEERNMWYAYGSAQQALDEFLEGTPMDIADLADELEALVQEALDAGITPKEVSDTLIAK